MFGCHSGVARNLTPSHAYMDAFCLLPREFADKGHLYLAGFLVSLPESPSKSGSEPRLHGWIFACFPARSGTKAISTWLDFRFPFRSHPANLAPSHVYMNGFLSASPCVRGHRPSLYGWIFGFPSAVTRRLWQRAMPTWMGSLPPPRTCGNKSHLYTAGFLISFPVSPT